MPPRRSFSQFQDGMSNRKSNAFEDIESQYEYLPFRKAAKGHIERENQREKSMNDVRHSVGLYTMYPLANSILAGASKREEAFRKTGSKQLNHVRGTDGWWRSMLVLEVRAIDNYFWPWVVVTLNALVATLLSEVGAVSMKNENLRHWDTVYSLVLKTSLAFLLVFRLNRVAMRFWETRTMWGTITHNTRNLVGRILTHCGHSQKHRDAAIRWASSFCVSAMHFIRGEHEIDGAELAGFLGRDEIDKLQDANHAPLYSATMTRYHLQKALRVTGQTSPGLAHSYSIHQNAMEELIDSLVAQVSGMEKIRSTPLPIVYVSHLRTFLFLYCILIPYVWVTEWGWSTLPLVMFTSFALFGIEGASSECEIPLDRSRPNHLAMDGYCLVILDGIQGLVVHDANLRMIEKQTDVGMEDENDKEVEEVWVHSD